MKAVELKGRREGLGYSQPELAAVLGVHPMTLSKWERKVLAIPVYIELAIEALEYRQKLASQAKKK